MFCGNTAPPFYPSSEDAGVFHEGIRVHGGTDNDKQSLGAIRRRSTLWQAPPRPRTLSALETLNDHTLRDIGDPPLPDPCAYTNLANANGETDVRSGLRLNSTSEAGVCDGAIDVRRPRLGSRAPSFLSVKQLKQCTPDSVPTETFPRYASGWCCPSATIACNNDLKGTLSTAHPTVGSSHEQLLLDFAVSQFAGALYRGY